jgi:hypothetical protein
MDIVQCQFSNSGKGFIKQNKKDRYRPAARKHLQNNPCTADGDENDAGCFILVLNTNRSAAVLPDRRMNGLRTAEQERRLPDKHLRYLCNIFTRPKHEYLSTGW